MTIVCTKCKLGQPPEEFHKDKSKKNGLNAHCKSCRVKYGHENRTHINAVAVEWRKNNKERSNEYRRMYSKEHPEYNRADLPSRKKWKENNPEKMKAYKRKYNRRMASTLDNKYLRGHLKIKAGGRDLDFTPEMFEMQKKCILLSRKIRDLNREMKASGVRSREYEMLDCRQERIDVAQDLHILINGSRAVGG